MANQAARHPGLIKLRHDVAVAVRWAARVLGAAALVTFVALAFVQGVPRSQFADQWEVTVEVAALAIGSLAWLVAWRWEGLGGALMVTASTFLGILASLEFHPATALWACLALFVPGALFLLHWQRARRPLTLAVVLAGMTLLLGTGAIGSNRVYDYYYGPTHPESDRARYPDDPVEWSWAGDVASHAFTVKAKLDHADAVVELVVAENEDLTGGRRVPGEAAAGGSDVRAYRVTGLRPGGTYFYGFAEGDDVQTGRIGRVRTFPEGPASFTIATASCARKGSNGLVFERIRELDPLLYLEVGDIHYENISANSPSKIRAALDRALGQPAQQALYLSTAIDYVWDDHDFGGDGADGTVAARPAARAVYREYVPHYDLPAGEGDQPIYHAFTIGRVRFIVTDGRSERDPSTDPDTVEKTMLGEKQKAWLKAELRAANGRYPLIIWAHSVPWIAEAKAGGDDWGGYSVERREIADFIVAEDIRGLAMISGDAHMLAIDDGSNNTFASDGKGPGFPVLHAAALDRRGKLKGGPYSEGQFAGGGQFALMTVTDDGGSTITVKWSGQDWKGEEKVRFEFSVPAPDPTRRLQAAP